MIDSTGTGPYALMATCKYRLPCGYCELKKKICKVDNPITITPTWTMTMTTPTEVTLFGREDVTKSQSSYPLPTIAESEVIRCKDCKYWNPHIKECEGIGKWFGLEDEWSENGFCFKWERKEE